MFCWMCCLSWYWKSLWLNWVSLSFCSPWQIWIWIKLLYSQLSATVWTNVQLSPGMPSQPSAFWSGHRAPCHCLFVVAKKYLGFGETTQNTRSCFTQMILLLFLSKPLTLLLSALSLLSQFCQLSGYKLNLNKSQLFPSCKANMLDFTNLK